MKDDGHLNRNFLRGSEGDAINAILAAVGHNLRLLRRWLAWLFALLLGALIALADGNAAGSARAANPTITRKQDCSQATIFTMSIQARHPICGAWRRDGQGGRERARCGLRPIWMRSR